MKPIREYHEVLVLRAIRTEKSISRIELARKLKLSRSTITLITHRMVSAGLLLEVGKGRSTERGGRREVLLALNPKMGVIMAAEIERNYTRLALLDIFANVIASRSIEYSKESKAEHLMSKIVQSFNELLAEQRFTKEQVIGIGLGVPGIIDYATRMVKEGYNTKRWEGYPICEILSHIFQVPVFLENNVKSVTLGEHHFGSGLSFDNLVCFWFGDGIGVGIMNHGQLLRGENNSAGEIGFTELFPGIQSNLSFLADSNNRIWGDLLSLANIQAAVAKGIASGWSTRLEVGCDVAAFLRAAEQSDPLALHLLKILGQLVTHIISQVVYFYNPSVFVLSGPLFFTSHLLYHELLNNIEHNVLIEPIQRTDFRMSSLRENGVLIGAGSLVIDDLFRLPDGENRSLTRDALVPPESPGDRSRGL